ncbi:hypothetical protein BACCAP_00613 [Pseudoflavonifractor capillosus ATCC 29799]|uniref:Uncharacterized protein n=1 Tax=Pseudoflavonifractor capillosus ATCC 29799 TaxID=411467 RepID=A6NQY9_9FIRM|nr:hypothetical protein BACCAP_00613 [Pseudoflavonifractor capillosus ATCC 29799]
MLFPPLSGGKAAGRDTSGGIKATLSMKKEYPFQIQT